MFSKRGWLAFLAIPCLFLLLISATISHAQPSYTTTWVTSRATRPIQQASENTSGVSIHAKIGQNSAKGDYR
jgi:hypothetical protein